MANPTTVVGYAAPAAVESRRHIVRWLACFNHELVEIAGNLDLALDAVRNGKAQALVVATLGDLPSQVLAEFASSGKRIMAVDEVLDSGTRVGRVFLSSYLALEGPGPGGATSGRGLEPRPAPRGKVPYGYRIENGKLIPFEPEQVVIRAMLEMAKLKTPANAIAKRLTEMGYRTRVGTHFSATQVIRSLGKDSRRKQSNR